MIVLTWFKVGFFFFFFRLKCFLYVLHKVLNFGTSNVNMPMSHNHQAMITIGPS